MTNEAHWNKTIVLPVISFTEKLKRKRRSLKEILEISAHKGFKAYQV